MPLYGGSSGGGSAIAVKDEGVALATDATSLDFVGPGVTASGVLGAKTITIPGGSNQLASIAAASAAIAATETVVASASLAAGFLVAGMSFRIRCAGVGTTGATPGSDIFRIRIGPTTLTGTIPTSVTALGIANVTAQPFDFEAIVTLRTSGAGGTIIGECVVQADNVATGRYAVLNSLSATVAAVAVDTTVANLLELTYISGNAGSSDTFHVATIEVLSSGATATKPPGYEYDYVETTTNLVVTATTEGTAQAFVTGSSVTYDGATIVNIEAYVPILAAGAGDLRVILWDNTAGVVVKAIGYSSVASSGGWTLKASYRFTPASGARVYSIRAYVNTGTGNLYANASALPNLAPGFIRITKV